MHLTFDAVIERLGAALAEPLPGASAHERLAPRPRGEWPAGSNPAPSFATRPACSCSFRTTISRISC